MPSWAVVLVIVVAVLAVVLAVRWSRGAFHRRVREAWGPLAARLGGSLAGDVLRVRVADVPIEVYTTWGYDMGPRGDRDHKIDVELAELRSDDLAMTTVFACDLPAAGELDLFVEPLRGEPWDTIARRRAEMGAGQGFAVVRVTGDEAFAERYQAISRHVVAAEAFLGDAVRRLLVERYPIVLSVDRRRLRLYALGLLDHHDTIEALVRAAATIACAPRT